jgi:putative N6-adenine-specific DNA methylase
MKLIAKTYEGFEVLLQKELENLGAKNIKPLKRAVEFEGNRELLYKANLHLRTAVKILVNIHSFKASNENELYENAKKINWLDHMGTFQSFAIDTVVTSEFFNHSKYVAYKVKDAIADHFREKRGRRPNVNTYDPDVKFNVRIYNDEVDISLDSSGHSLHMRGYRVESLAAPLSEVLAAGIMMFSEFEKHNTFLDPMCGSGTLSTEALMINTNTAPNLHREKFGFMGWSDYEPSLWQNIREEALSCISEPEMSFMASDIDRKAVFAAKKNLSLLTHGDKVEVKHGDFFKLKSINENAVIIINPPYDMRIESDDVVKLYTDIGDKLKQDFSGATAWVFSANMEALKFIGLKPAKKIKLMNGKLPAELRKFELY